MRGRTNIGGGGLLINGDVVNYAVKAGSTIIEGDFVQIDDSVTPTTAPVSLGSNFLFSFSLSDGRQITFFSQNVGSVSYLGAVIDEVDSSGLLESVLYGQVLNLNIFLYYIIQISSDTFLVMASDEDGNGCIVSFATVTFDVLTNTFSYVYHPLKGVNLLKGRSVGSKPALFYADYIGDQKVFVICARKTQASDTQGKLVGLVYDLQTEEVVASKVITYVYFDGSETSEMNVASYKLVAKLSNGSYLYSNKGATRSFVFTYNGSTVTSSEKNYPLNFIATLNGNKFLSINGSNVSVLNYESGAFSVLGTYIAPFSIQRIFYFNNKIFIIDTNTSSGNVNICALVYDPSTDEIIFSDVSLNAFYVNDGFAINNQYFTTYYLTNRKTVKELNGKLFSFSQLQTIKKYVNRIDGVANGGGIGGDTIEVFVPASS